MVVCLDTDDSISLVRLIMSSPGVWIAKISSQGYAAHPWEGLSGGALLRLVLSNRAKGQRRKEGMLRPEDRLLGKEDSVNFTILDVSDYDPPHVCVQRTGRRLARIRGTHNLSLKKVPKQPNGVICAAGVQFMPFMPQDGPKNIIWSLGSPIPIVIYEFHVIGVGRNGVWGDFGSTIQRSLVNLLPNP